MKRNLTSITLYIKMGTTSARGILMLCISGMKVVLYQVCGTRWRSG